MVLYGKENSYGCVDADNPVGERIRRFHTGQPADHDIFPPRLLPAGTLL